MRVEGWEPITLAAKCVTECGDDNDLLRLAGAMIRAQFDEVNKLRKLLRRATTQELAPHSWSQELWDAIDAALGDACQKN